MRFHQLVIVVHIGRTLSNRHPLFAFLRRYILFEGHYRALQQKDKTRAFLRVASRNKPQAITDTILRPSDSYVTRNTSLTSTVQYFTSVMDRRPPHKPWKSQTSYSRENTNETKKAKLVRLIVNIRGCCAYISKRLTSLRNKEQLRTT